MIKSTVITNTSIKNFFRKLGALGIALLISFSIKAQIAPGYEVATWHGFKPAAVSYTFDDNNRKQLTVAIPLFDQYDFNATLFTVTDWGPNWSGLRAAFNNGHEIASHTVSHNNLNSLSIENQEKELRESQSIIRANVPNAGSLTIAYPNCNIGDIPTLEKYYLAGRVCSGRIEPKTPNDFYRISSIIVGSEGAVKSAEDFNNKVLSARSSEGWAVFLMHGIDNDGGYSPIASSELESHLAHMDTQREDYWVATFGDVVQYIKERDAISLKESAVTADSLRLTVTDNLDDALFNVPVTVRRLLPSGWANARVYAGKQLINAEISTVEGQQYIVFDVIPDQGEVYLANPDKIVAGLKGINENPSLKVGPNPFTDTVKIEARGAFKYMVYAMDGRLTASGEAVDTKILGKNFEPGPYLLKIYYKNEVYGSKIIRK